VTASRISRPDLDATFCDCHFSDDELFEWAMRHGYDKYPIAHIELSGQILSTQPDTATIHFCETPVRVVRFCARGL
jgi:hypothetical protein